MSKNKLTPWFQQQVQPSIPGVYQREMGYCRGGIGYAKWDGAQWSPCFNDVNAADRLSEFRDPSGYQCEDGEIRWRGLAAPPTQADNRKVGMDAGEV